MPPEFTAHLRREIEEIDEQLRSLESGAIVCREKKDVTSSEIAKLRASKKSVEAVMQ
jgi:hypothetical protein